MLDYDDLASKDLKLDRDDMLNAVSDAILRMNRAGNIRPVTKFHPVGLDHGPGDSIGDALQFEAGLHLMTSEDSGSGPFVGMALLRDLVMRRYLAAYRAMGLFFVHGLFSGGPSKAKPWFERGIEAGSIECLFELAQIYELGEGESQEMAHRLYELSAEAGDFRGQHVLAMRLCAGNPYKDDSRAFSLLLRAAEHGYNPAEYGLGVFYELGLGVAKNPVEAYKWYERAASSGEAPAALVRLALLCVMNPDIPLLRENAAKWAAKGAASGSVDAQNILGKIHALGFGVSKDAKKAVEWFTRAAEAGSELGILNLVHVYREGFGDVAPAPELTVKWAMRGLELNFPTAKYVLSRMYRAGTFLERDAARAERLEAELGPEGLAEAMGLVAVVEREFACGEDRDPFEFKSHQS